MMKNLSRALKWFAAIVISLVCLYGCFVGIWFIFWFLFDLEIGETRALARGVVVIYLTGAYLVYILVVEKSNRTSLVTLACVIIGLLVISDQVFSERQAYQEEIAIRDICAQFNQAKTRGDYETAYKFMSPEYRQAHSLEAFIREKGWFTCSPFMTVSVRHPATRKAYITQGGSLLYTIYLEKLGPQWYFTGEDRLSQG